MDLDSDQPLAITKAIIEVFEMLGGQWMSMMQLPLAKRTATYSQTIIRDLYMSLLLSMTWNWDEDWWSRVFSEENTALDSRGDENSSRACGWTSNWDVWIWRRCVSDICYVNIDIVVGLTGTVARFKVINALTSYFMLLGRHWIYKNHVLPFTYFNASNCTEGQEGGRNASEAHSRRMRNTFRKLHFWRANRDWEVTPAHPRGVSMPKWEKIYE